MRRTGIDEATKVDGTHATDRTESHAELSGKSQARTGAWTINSDIHAQNVTKKIKKKKKSIQLTQFRCTRDRSQIKRARAHIYMFKQCD